MSRAVVVDTDVLVDFLRGHPKAEAFIGANADCVLLSSIVVAELFAGARSGREETALDALVALFRVVPVSREIARLGGLYKRDYGKSHGVGLADAILAATAAVEGADLATLNVKHYPMIKGVKAPYAKA